MRYNELKTPSYIVSEKKLKENLRLLKSVEERSGAKILLAQKAFSMFSVYPLIGEYLTGTTASGIFEAKLAHEEMKGRENHVFEPAYKDDEMDEILELCDHVYFNSFTQLKCHEEKILSKLRSGDVKIAIRVNPEFSTQEGHEIYDPCSPKSRLGVRLKDMPDKLPDYVTGLHMHTLCEQGFEPLKATFEALEKRFGKYLSQVKWINLGGGHHITREGYDFDSLVEFIKDIIAKYDVEVYLEPGEAIALDAGFLITEVMDIVDTPDMPTLILDSSAACHMPDVLEMPYLPPLVGSVESGVKVRLASRTCLAGDVIGEYDLPEIPKVGDILTFGDMAIYSMVKNNTFNGMPLPDIVLERENGDYEVIKRFGYSDFKERLS
ncbi:MAG: carboxynorspermidine decarboxylase [Clostridiales bacterium]|nr:carboxynorspermidine decarboxylase [Clostridiales bacterium]